MNTRITMGLAILLLLGALLAGYWGVVLSRQPEPAVAAPVAQAPQAAVAPVAPPPPEDPLRQAVVVLLRDVAANVPIKAEDLVVEKLKVAPAGSFSSVDEVLDRASWRDLKAGTWLNAESFAAGGILARMIRPGERALGLSVDEVTTLGGQLMPGDYVDVLLYLPADIANPDRSSQIAVPALRVLSIGEVLGPTNDGQPAQSISSSDRQQLEQRRAAARTVVLAVPESLVTRLMLAAQSGTLRLAVRSSDEKNLEHYWANNSAAERDVALRLDTEKRSLVPYNKLSMSSPAPLPATPGAVPAAPRQVPVIRGAQAAQQPTPTP
ncbi:Flp pilus assembly protein CpaB [Pseudomonas sp. Pseusp122]|uniref:Flp pilus assembly protein CpaB n=1 Tax=unclassified Pseudomonas TaxID=196821 RepID=UPI0039A50B81